MHIYSHCPKVSTASEGDRLLNGFLQQGHRLVADIKRPHHANAAQVCAWHRLCVGVAFRTSERQRFPFRAVEPSAG